MSNLLRKYRAKMLEFGEQGTLLDMAIFLTVTLINQDKSLTDVLRNLKASLVY